MYYLEYQAHSYMIYLIYEQLNSENKCVHVNVANLLIVKAEYKEWIKY